jgi:hypothetical protein
VAGVRDDPAARLELPSRFYGSPGQIENIRPYRRAEMVVHALADKTRGPGAAPRGHTRQSVMASCQRRSTL